jgi:hypothetical protein
MTLAAPRSDRSPTRPVQRMVYHFSEDGTIERFVPQLAPSDPSQPPAVWAIDAQHSPLYWFPRFCPRVSVWATDDAQQETLTARFATDASRICAAETGWLDRIRACRLYRYEFEMSRFSPWDDADGEFVSSETLEPDRVVALDDLLGLHAAADLELRITPKLGGLMDQILESGLPFGFVRLRDARR